METFNLKAAIEYQLKNCTLIKLMIISTLMTHFTDEAAQEALTDMPPRSEEVHVYITLYIPNSLTYIAAFLQILI